MNTDITEEASSICKVFDTPSRTLNHNCAELLAFMIYKGYVSDDSCVQKFSQQLTVSSSLSEFSDVSGFIERRKNPPSFTLKSVGGTLADAILLDFTHEGESLEGQDSRTSSAFVLDVLNGLYQKLGDYLHPKNIHECSEIIENLLKSVASCHLFSHQIIPHEGPMTFKRPLNESVNIDLLKSNLMLFAVENLRVEKSILFPFGFLGIGFGHAMLLEVVKIDSGRVDIIVYNTGDGVENHENFFDGTKVKASTILQFSKVPISLLIDSGFFKSAYEVMTYRYSKKELYSADIVYNSVLRVFSSLQPFKTKQEKEVFTGIQKSGTCHIRVYHAFFFHKLKASLYREFKIILHKFIIDEVMLLRVPMNNAMKQILEEGIKQTSNSTLKMMKMKNLKTTLIRPEDLKNLIFSLWRHKQNLEQVKTAKEKNQQLLIPEKLAEVDMKSVIDELRKTTAGLSDDQNESSKEFEYFHLPPIDPAQPILDYLGEVRGHLEKFVEVGGTPEVVLESKLDLFTHIILNSAHPNFDSISSPLDALNIVCNLGEYLFQLIHSVKEVVPRFSRALCYYKLLAWTIELERLTKESDSTVSLHLYNLHPQTIEKHRTLPGVLSFSNEVEKKFDDLLVFLNSCHDPSKESLLLIKNEGILPASFSHQEDTILHKVLLNLFEKLPKPEQEKLRKKGDESFHASCNGAQVRKDINYELMSIFVSEDRFPHESQAVYVMRNLILQLFTMGSHRAKSSWISSKKNINLQFKPSFSSCNLELKMPIDLKRKAFEIVSVCKSSGNYLDNWSEDIGWLNWYSQDSERMNEWIRNVISSSDAKLQSLSAISFLMSDMYDFKYKLSRELFHCHMSDCSFRRRLVQVPSKTLLKGSNMSLSLMNVIDKMLFNYWKEILLVPKTLTVMEKDLIQAWLYLLLMKARYLNIICENEKDFTLQVQFKQEIREKMKFLALEAPEFQYQLYGVLAILNEGCNSDPSELYEIQLKKSLSNSLVLNSDKVPSHIMDEMNTPALGCLDKLRKVQMETSELSEILGMKVVEKRDSFPWLVLRHENSTFWINIVNAFMVKDGIEMKNSSDAFKASDMYNHLKLLDFISVNEITSTSWNAKTKKGNEIRVTSSSHANFAYKFVDSIKYFILQTKVHLLPFKPHKSYLPYLTWISSHQIRFESKNEELISEIDIQENKVLLEGLDWKLISNGNIDTESQIVKFEKPERITILQRENRDTKLIFNNLCDFDSNLPLVFNLNHKEGKFRLQMRPNLFLDEDQNLQFILDHDFLVLLDDENNRSFISALRLDIDKESSQSLMISVGRDFLHPQSIVNSRIVYNSIPALKTRVSKMVYSLALMKQKSFNKAFKIMKNLDHFQPYSPTEESLLQLMVAEFYLKFPHVTTENAAFRFLLLSHIWKNYYSHCSWHEKRKTSIYKEMFIENATNRPTESILSNYYALAGRIPTDLQIHVSYGDNQNPDSFLAQEDEISLLESLKDCTNSEIIKRLKRLKFGPDLSNTEGSRTYIVGFDFSIESLFRHLNNEINPNIDEITIDLTIGNIEHVLENNLSSLIYYAISGDWNQTEKVRNFVEKIEMASKSPKFKNIIMLLKSSLNYQTKEFIRNLMIFSNDVSLSAHFRKDLEKRWDFEYKRSIITYLLGLETPQSRSTSEESYSTPEFQLPSEIPEKLTFRPKEELMKFNNYSVLFSVAEVPEDFVEPNFNIKDKSEYASRKLASLLKQISMKKGTIRKFAVQNLDKMKNDLSAMLLNYLAQRETLVKELYEIIIPIRKQKSREALIFATIMSGKQPHLSLHELVQLFGRRDARFYKLKFPLLKDVENLHCKIGDFCCLLIQIQQIGRILDLIFKLHNLVASSDNFIEKQQEIIGELYSEICYVRPYDISEMPFLFVFETMENITIRSSHVYDLKKLLHLSDDGYFVDFILQRSMASGKTFLVDPILAHEKSNGKSLHVLMLPESLFVNNSRDICARIGNLFNQKCLIFTFPRMGSNDFAERVRYLRIKLERAVSEKSTVVATPSQIQMFQNTFLKTFLSEDTNPEVESELEKIFLLFRQRAERTQDEMEMSNNPFAEFNFSLKDNIHLNDVASEVITKIFHEMVTNYEITDKLGLRSNEQVYFDQATNMKWMLSIIFENVIWPWIKNFMPSREDKANLYKMMTDDEKQDSDSNSNDVKRWFASLAETELKDFAEPLAILRSFMIDWLPKLLNQSVDHNFGFSVREREEKPFAIPYSAGNTPKEGSEFAGVWEVLLKTIATYLVKGLSIPQADRYLRKLRLIAINEMTSSKLKQNLEDNLILKRLQILLKDRHIIDLDPGSEEDLKYFQLCLNSTGRIATDFMFSFIGDEIIPKILSKKLQITNYPLFLSLMFKSNQGFSGTIENTFMFPSEILRNNLFELDDTSNGNVMRSILSQRAYRLGTIERINTSLDEIISQILKQGMEKEHAIIDLGAQFKGFSNKEVAFSICKYYQQKENGRKAALFFDDESGKLSFWKCNNLKAGYQQLSSSTREAILSETECKSLEDIFAFYGNLHIVGADIPHVSDAIAFVMLGMDIKFSDLLQAVMRMRKLLTSQQLIFIATPELEKALNGNGKVDSYISLAIQNSVETERQQNFLLFRQKCLVKVADSVFKNIPKLQSRQEKSSLLKSFDWVFIRDLTEHYVKDYLAESYTSTADHVLKKQIEFFEKKLQKSIETFSKLTGKTLDLNDLSTDFKNILDLFPMLDENMISTSCPLDAPSGGIVEQQQEQEQEQEIQMEQQQVQQSLGGSDYERKRRNYLDSDFLIHEHLQSSEFSYFRLDDILHNADWPKGLFSQNLIMSDAGCLSSPINGPLVYGVPDSLLFIPIPITSYILQFQNGSPYLVMGNSKDTEELLRYLSTYQKDSFDSRDILIVEPYSSYFLNANEFNTDGESANASLWTVKHANFIKELMFQCLWYTGNCGIISDPYWKDSMEEFLNGPLRLQRLRFYSQFHLKKCDEATKNRFSTLDQ